MNSTTLQERACLLDGAPLPEPLDITIRDAIRALRMRVDNAFEALGRASNLLLDAEERALEGKGVLVSHLCARADRDIALVMEELGR